MSPAVLAQPGTGGGDGEEPGDGLSPSEDCTSSCQSTFDIDFTDENLCSDEIGALIHLTPGGPGDYLVVKLYTGTHDNFEIERGYTVFTGNPAEVDFDHEGPFWFKIYCQNTLGTEDPKDDVTFGICKTDPFNVDLVEEVDPRFTINDQWDYNTSGEPVLTSCTPQNLTADWWLEGNPPSYCSDPTVEHRYLVEIIRDGQLVDKFNEQWVSGCPESNKDLGKVQFQEFLQAGDLVRVLLQTVRQGCPSQISVDFRYLGNDGDQNFDFDFYCGADVDAAYGTDFDDNDRIQPAQSSTCSDPTVLGGGVQAVYSELLDQSYIELSELDYEIYIIRDCASGMEEKIVDHTHSLPNIPYDHTDGDFWFNALDVVQPNSIFFQSGISNDYFSLAALFANQSPPQHPDYNAANKVYKVNFSFTEECGNTISGTEYFEIDFENHTQGLVGTNNTNEALGMPVHTSLGNFIDRSMSTEKQSMQNSTHLSVYDINGRTVLSQPLETTLHKTFEGLRFEQGAYFYLLTGANGQTETGKFILY